MYKTTVYRLVKVSITHTRRGQSRAQHVQDREADIEKSEKLGSGAFAMLQRRSPQGRADALAIVDLWRKEDRADEPIFGAV